MADPSTPPPPVILETAFAVESRDWPVLQELLSGASGGSDGAREEVLRCGAPARHPKNHRQEALGKMLPSPVNSDGLTGERGAASPVPPDRRQRFWSNSDIHFDIVHRRKKKERNKQKHIDCVSSSKVQ